MSEKEFKATVERIAENNSKKEERITAMPCDRIKVTEYQKNMMHTPPYAGFDSKGRFIQ